MLGSRIVEPSSLSRATKPRFDPIGLAQALESIPRAKPGPPSKMGPGFLLLKVYRVGSRRYDARLEPCVVFSKKFSWG